MDMVRPVLTARRYKRMFRHLLRVEWKHTYCSARREYTRAVSARKFVREVYRGVLDLPARNREERLAWAPWPRELGPKPRA